MIQFKNIIKSFGPKTVLDDVSFDVPRAVADARNEARTLLQRAPRRR